MTETNTTAAVPGNRPPEHARVRLTAAPSGLARATELCAWMGDTHGPDSHAAVSVEVSQCRYAIGSATDLPREWTVRLTGSGTAAAPLAVVLEIEGPTRLAANQTCLFSIDIRDLPLLVQSLATLEHRARGLGMLPPDEG